MLHFFWKYSQKNLILCSSFYIGAGWCLPKTILFSFFASYLFNLLPNRKDVISGNPWLNQRLSQNGQNGSFAPGKGTSAGWAGWFFYWTFPNYPSYPWYSNYRHSQNGGLLLRNYFENLIYIIGNMLILSQASLSRGPWLSKLLPQNGSSLIRHSKWTVLDVADSYVGLLLQNLALLPSRCSEQKSETTLQPFAILLLLQTLLNIDEIYLSWQLKLRTYNIWLDWPFS